MHRCSAKQRRLPGDAVSGGGRPSPYAPGVVLVRLRQLAGQWGPRSPDHEVHVGGNTEGVGIAVSSANTSRLGDILTQPFFKDPQIVALAKVLVPVSSMHVQVGNRHRLGH